MVSITGPMRRQKKYPDAASKARNTRISAGDGWSMTDL
jgi:hypothetical protein